uniref:CAZy families CBM48/GH13 protein n=1 Tax=uncultured Mobiluncus sp. TaxID=293425 RepID=A0A060BWC3_9ACTO|nr:CAZy families CBM48/GH13 protein [uncultured Mobiluncus sp.]
MRYPRPFTSWENTIIYEAHVKGLTQRAPDIPEDLRGTYAGLAHPASIARLKNLGISAIEPLPIHAKMPEAFLTQKGLPNYWGYSTLSFFSPEPSYATAQAQRRGGTAVRDEVRSMIDALHEAGIEVILDVVYNHTCEGGNDGPT